MLKFVATDADADTEWSPAARPDVLAGPAQRLQRQQVAAALFGGSGGVAHGRYQLLHRLGEGGLGVVYAAYDEHLARKIALKLIRPGGQDSAGTRERTLREARALARLSHPNVVHVYEVGELDGQLFVAMEFLAGPTLLAWHKGQVRPWRETLRLFAQAGEGLAAAHREGIVHRDFKPQNAMLGADGRVRVLDFGLARLGELDITPNDTTPEPVLTQPALTMTGAVLGTPAYMAPEQFTGRTASERSDQFSFCVALFEALHGYRPFQAETLAEQIDQLHAGRTMAPPRDTAVPPRIHAVLLRGLQADPAARWSSMRALLTALERDPAVRLRRTLAAVALVAVTGVGSYALARPTQPAAEQCPDASLELAEVWSEARATTMREAVRERHGAQGAELMALVEPRIDAYAAQWSKQRNEVCQTHTEGHQSVHVFDLRAACLDQRRASLDAVVQIVAAAGEGPLAGVAQATQGLPGLERCDDTQALLAAIAPPEDPAMQARVQAHRETLARALAHEDAAQYQRGLDLVATVLADEAALAHEPLKAEAYLHKGSLEMNLDTTEAVRSLETSLWTALATGHAPVAAQASSKRAFTLGVQLRKHEQAIADLPMITALNQRVADDIELYAEYLNNIGAIHKMRGDWAESRRWLEQARDLRLAHDHPVNWRSLATLEHLARLSMMEKRHLEALALYREALDIHRALGLSYTSRVGTELAFAGLLIEAGRPRAASALVQQVMHAREPIEGTAMTVAMLSLAGRLAMDADDPTTAREQLGRISRLSPENSYPKHYIESMLMYAAALDGDAAAMEAHRAEVVRALAGANKGPPCWSCGYLMAYGRALAVLDRSSEAILVYEQVSAQVADATFPYDRALHADNALSLGKAHRKQGDHPAAERELLRALTEYRALYPVPGQDHARALHELGELALSQQRWPEAVAQLREAEASYAVTAEPDYPPLARTRFALARALTGASTSVPAPARALAEAAATALAGHPDEAAAITAWLANPDAPVRSHIHLRSPSP